MGKLKSDINDTLWSEIVRKGHEWCLKCGKPNKINGCHIFGRRHYSTRHDPENGVPLCFTCHTWFDSHKIPACLFDETKRVFSPDEEGFHWLVSIGRTWDGLQKLYHKSRIPFKGYKGKKKQISINLRKILEM